MGDLLSSLLQERDYLIQSLKQRWDFLSNSLPLDIVIDSKVGMTHSVSHSGHTLPWNVGKLPAYVIRYMFRSFPNDFDGTLHGASGL